MTDADQRCPSSPEFDQCIDLLFATPFEFPKLASAKPELLQVRGLHNETLLHYVVVENQIDAVLTLLSLGADPGVINRFGNTPLHDASKVGLVEIARVLLEHGANIDQKSPDGSTVLHYAAEYNQPDTYRFLLQRGADSTLANDFDETPEALARRFEGGDGDASDESSA